MMTEKQYEVAKLADYGYRDYSIVKKIFNIFIKIICILSIFMLYVPVIMIAIQSFNSNTDIFMFDKFTFEWYGKIFTNYSLFNAIKNTFVVSIIAVVLSTLFGTFIAIGIHALSPKRRKQITILNNVPILNADIVTGLSLMFIFSLLLPIFPYIFGIPTLVLAHMFFTMPYVILSVLPKLRELDPNLIDAATDLGIKPVTSIFRVVIPAVRAGIISGMLLAFTMSIDDFIISFFTSGNGYDNLSIWIYSSIGKKSLTPSVYAFSTLMIAVILIGLFVRHFISSMMTKRKKRVA